ncbi:hypothetical protein SBA_pBAR1_510 (plasmid) [Sphingomonas bisphenolicum]|uniref:Uncharacterized protein n=1 Tax=Sphingomonas bisphenolicum TaxID=296544 RepID=A0ABM7GAK2_9SPHN|nr:hypothetical protein SBA_pBAR1_510 [Sphingomonas bisphenolicum]
MRPKPVSSRDSRSWHLLEKKEQAGKRPPAIGPPSVPLDPHSKGPAPRNAPRLTPNGRFGLGAFIWNAGATAA